MAQDYWWLTRPKRKLDPIPEELAAFSAVAITQQWTGNRKQQIAYEGYYYGNDSQICLSLEDNGKSVIL